MPHCPHRMPAALAFSSSRAGTVTLARCSVLRAVHGHPIVQPAVAKTTTLMSRRAPDGAASPGWPVQILGVFADQRATIVDRVIAGME